MSSSLRVYSTQIADLVLSLFTVGQHGLVKKWLGRVGYIPSPFVAELKRARSAGSRALFVSVSRVQMVPADEVLSVQDYTLDIIAFQYVGEASQNTAIADIQEELVNYVLDQVGPWAEHDTLKANNLNQNDFTVYAATINAVTYEVASPLQQQGWFAVALNMTVRVSTNTH